MNLNEIKRAIEAGSKVYWSNLGYEVIKDNIGQYLIHCNINDTYIGLTHRDNVTMNCNSESEFFTNPDELLTNNLHYFSRSDLQATIAVLDVILQSQPDTTRAQQVEDIKQLVVKEVINR